MTKSIVVSAPPIQARSIQARSIQARSIQAPAVPLLAGPAYHLVLSNSAADIEAAQRLRYRVFSTEPGFGSAMSTVVDGRDADRFDEHCDHILVRHNVTDEVVGCYRMLPPPGAAATGGLYTATEFDLGELAGLASQTVEMGRACVDAAHRSGSVMALMWAGILRYLDATGYRYVLGCTSVPVCSDASDVPGATIRGVRDLVRNRHQAPWQAFPYRHVVIDGRRLDDIDPPAALAVPGLLRGYLRLGAQICGEPAHDVDFGVGDFVTVLDKTSANERYLQRLRSAADAAQRRDTTPLR